MKNIATSGNSLAVQWLELGAFTARARVWGLSLIAGQGTKIPQAMWHSQKKKKEKESATSI